MHGVSISNDFIYSELDSIGYKNIEIIGFQMSSNGGFHTCVLAEKPV